MRVQVGTFNCNLQGAAAVSPDLTPWLVPTIAENKKVYNATDASQGRDAPDIYAVGFQELLPLPMGFAANEEATDAIDATDREIRRAVRYHAAMTRPDGLYPPGHTGGPETYDLVASVHMVGIVLFVYTRIKSGVSERVKEIRTAKVGTGLLGIMGNKGAVGIRLVIAGEKPNAPDEVYTFLSAHLAAHDHNVPRRNRDWANIVRRMVFTPKSVLALPLIQDKTVRGGAGAPSASQLEDRYKAQKSIQPKDAEPLDTRSYGVYDSTHLFVFGDLNYRIALKKLPMPGSHADKQSHGKMAKDDLRWRLASADWAALASYDQLSVERLANRVFHGLIEPHLPSIKWGPTYKFKVIKPAVEKSPFQTGNFSKDEKVEEKEPGTSTGDAASATSTAVETKVEKEAKSETAPLFAKISAPPKITAADGQELSKKRVPGWTDRILWASAHDAARISGSGSDTHGVEVELYRSVIQFTHSDHKPVTAILKIDSTKQPSSSSRTPLFLKDSSPQPITTPYTRDSLWAIKLFLGTILDRILGFIWVNLVRAGAGSLITGLLEAIVVLVLSLWYLRGGQGDASWWLSSVLRGGRS
ncbi:hypothetical protein CF319_g2768 [Tilletia indica]|uniref:Inositol polyphosphate-related phosphatase domain-containing protein n=1 Tax=Tilletia indica TaxID=43049 RepID=A0A177TK38_9BASI|nr:hypothetical protein CF319_g2768 [Tilletia indica]KAE8255709.1 hypothetical protein A4X13_0g2941 [Tilletia indica]